jgi:formylglycine-generating enzyme required for sulfatase activity
VTNTEFAEFLRDAGGYADDSNWIEAGRAWRSENQSKSAATLRATDAEFNRERPYVDAERNREDASESRVARGGSWYSASVALLYIPYRDSFQPEVSHHDLSFRIVARPLP